MKTNHSDLFRTHFTMLKKSLYSIHEYSFSIKNLTPCKIDLNNGRMNFINFDKSNQKLFLDSVSLPKLNKKEKLIKIKSFGINRADLVFKSGKYPRPKDVSQILGLECAGYVVDDQGNIDYDNKVMALVPGGSYAEYVAINEDHLIKIPKNIDINIAGGIPEVYLTSLLLLRYVKDSGNLYKGSNILVHGAASGIGTTVIQLIKKIHQGNVIAIVGNEEKIKIMKDLNVDFTCLRQNENKNEEIKKYLSTLPNNKLNAVLDHVGRSEFTNNLNLLGVDGTFVSYGTVSGTKVENIDLRDLLFKRLNLFFTVLSTRSDDFKTQLCREFSNDLLPKLSSGDLKVFVHKHFPFSVEAIEDAHSIMKKNENVGKLIINF